jgi:hypothetical protein
MHVEIFRLLHIQNGTFIVIQCCNLQKEKRPTKHGGKQGPVFGRITKKQDVEEVKEDASGGIYYTSFEAVAKPQSCKCRFSIFENVRR